MKCSICGANVEETKYEDGSVLIRRDCQCDPSRTGIRYDPHTGWPLPFAMGVCGECKQYVSPGFMIWEGNPCPLCKKPFYLSSNYNAKEEES